MTYAFREVAGLRRGVIWVLLGIVVLTPAFFTTYLSDYNTPKLAIVQVLTTLACAVWLVGMATEGVISLVQSPIYYALLAFMAANFISLFQAYNRSQGLETMFQYLCYFLLYIVTLNCVDFRPDAGTRGRRSEPSEGAPEKGLGVTLGKGGRTILWTITITASLLTVVGLLQYNRLYDFSAPWSLPVSTLGNVTFVAEYLDVALPLAVALALARGGALRYLAGLGALLMLCLVAVLGSRGGWVGTGISTAVFIGSWGWRAWRSGRRIPNISVLRGGILVLALVLAIAVVPRLPAGNGVTVGKVLADRWEAIFHRSESAARLQDESTVQRLLIWKDTLGMIADRPVQGVGVGNFAYNLPKYASRESAESLARMRAAVGMDLAVYQAHNGYLEVLAETGILGLAAFGWMFYAICGMYFRLMRRYASGEADLLAVGVTAAASATLVHAMFSLNFQNPVSASHFWIVTGLAAGLESRVSGGGSRLPILETGSGSGVLGVAGVSGGALLLVCVTSFNSIVGDFYYNLGRYDWKARTDRGRLERSRVEFERAVAYVPHSFSANQMLGNACNDLGLWQEAEAAYRRSLADHPNNRMVHKLLGEVLIRTERYEEGAEAFRSAVRLDPLFAEAFFRLGYCERQSGRPDEAIQAYSEALALEPQNVEFRNSLGAARISKGDYAGAVAELTRASAANPSHAGVQTNLGIASFLLGRTEEALGHYRRAIELDPRLANAYILTGQVYQDRLRDTVRAREYYEKALSISPDDPRIRTLIDRLGKGP